MSRFHSYINSAKQVIQRYKGGEPLASFLKKFFALDKKFGSRDRKQISHLCYCYFRLGHALPSIDLTERMLAGLFLCSNESNEILEELRPEWNAAAKLSLEEKYSIVNPDNNGDQFSILDVFPWQQELSEGIEYEKFCESFLIQPDVYLRLRPGFENKVRENLSNGGIKYSQIYPNCIAIEQGVKIENMVALDKEAVVQDLNSQRVGEFLPLGDEPSDPGRSDGSSGKPSDRLGSDSFPLRVWDCCAGSGGKSLLACDLNPKIELTVSDSRKSIIDNLKKRFSSAGIKHYRSKILDLSEPHLPPDSYRVTIHHSPFDLIICDTACTGSGTWSRTPEQLYFFDPKKIDDYSALQKKIISNSISQLKDGGYFVYITCSIFRKENEENIEFIKTQFDFEVVKIELLKGYDKKADSLFVAAFKKYTS